MIDLALSGFEQLHGQSWLQIYETMSGLSKHKIKKLLKKASVSPDLMCKNYKVSDDGRIYLPNHKLCVSRVVPWLWVKDPTYKAFDEHSSHLRFLHSMSPEANFSLAEAQKLIIDVLLGLYHAALTDPNYENKLYFLGCIIHCVADSWSPAHTKRMTETELQEYIQSLKDRKLFSSNKCIKGIDTSSKKMLERERDVISLIILYRMETLISTGKVKITDDEQKTFSALMEVFWSDKDFYSQYKHKYDEIEKYIDNHKNDIWYILKERLYFDQFQRKGEQLDLEITIKPGGSTGESSEKSYITAFQYFDVGVSLIVHNGYDKISIAKEMGLLNKAIQEQVDIMSLFIQALIDQNPKDENNNDIMRHLSDFATLLYERTFLIPEQLKDFYAARLIRYNTFGLGEHNILTNAFSKGAKTYIEDKPMC